MPVKTKGLLEKTKTLLCSFLDHPAATKIATGFWSVDSPTGQELQSKRKTTIRYCPRCGENVVRVSELK